MAALLFKWLLISLPFWSGVSANAYGAAPAEARHPFYVSVVEITHNAKEKTLEISCKIFADDMEGVLKQQYKTAVDLTVESQHKQNDAYILDYVKKHLALTTDGKGAPLQYVGFEKEAESVYCYFEVPRVASVKKLDVANSLLQDFTQDQINIMHVIVGGQRKSYKLNYPQKSASFTF